MSAFLERMEKLEPRERRLLLVLVAIFLAMVILGIPLGVGAVIDSRREENDRVREIIGEIHAGRASIAERQARRAAVLARYATPAPPLAGFIEETARANGLEIPESQDRPQVPHGKKYTERTTVVRLRRVSLLPLVKTLEAIERSGLPVAVTRLQLKARGGEADAFDVELGVSAFDRKAADSPGVPTGAGVEPPREPAP